MVGEARAHWVAGRQPYPMWKKRAARHTSTSSQKAPQETPLTAIILFQMAVFVTGQESEPEPRARGLAIAGGPAAVTHCPWPVARKVCEDNVRASQPCAVLILWMATATWYMQGEMREPARSEMHPVSISSPVYDSGAMDGNQPVSLFEETCPG